MRVFRGGVVRGRLQRCSTTLPTENSTHLVPTKESPDEVKERKGSFLEPSDDVVIEYARRVLQRENRDQIPESIIWKEETTHMPILSRGQRNFYDYTDDIPAHVKPFWSHEWYQQREYFKSQRTKSSWGEWLRLLWVAGLVSTGLISATTLVRIWISQPKDLMQLRNELLQLSYGRTLELAAGQGQSIGLYPYGVSEVVLSDASSQQLQNLRYRIPKTSYPTYEIRHMKSEQLEDFEDSSFDCVIDMFGLCHYRDPLMALRQMQRVVKPTGTILLLEHGRSPYPPVNWFLDWCSDRHRINTHGCRWNMPIRDYLKDSRMEIRELRNKHFGTTYYVVAYPENLDQLKKDVETVFATAYS